jgi:stage V sporulation protein AE
MGELIMELVKIFIAGGVFCMFGEVLWAKTGLGVVKTLMVCIAAGVALDVAGILGPVIGFGQEGFTVTIYGAGASIFDGVMGSVRDHGLSGIIRLTNFYFLRFSGLIVCTMVMAAVLGFLFPGTRGK